jgi:sterol desaturase/sphingolipid hydroxylase (fatty acid hydroxylase superfamily)
MRILPLITGTIVTSAIASEVSTYAWHRWGCHTKELIIPYVAHEMHHMMRDWNANADFIIASIITIAVSFVTICIAKYIGWKNAMTCAVTVCIVFSFYAIVKNRLHAAYHVPHHTLNNFEWFREWKRLHQIHHERPTKNFAISCFSIDKLFGTFDDGHDNEKPT